MTFWNVDTIYWGKKIWLETVDYSNESQLSLNYRYLDSICNKFGLSKVQVL